MTTASAQASAQAVRRLAATARHLESGISATATNSSPTSSPSSSLNTSTSPTSASSTSSSDALSIQNVTIIGAGLMGVYVLIHIQSLFLFFWSLASPGFILILTNSLLAVIEHAQVLGLPKSPFRKAST